MADEAKTTEGGSKKSPVVLIAIVGVLVFLLIIGALVAFMLVGSSSEQKMEANQAPNSKQLRVQSSVQMTFLMLVQCILWISF